MNTSVMEMLLKKVDSTCFTQLEKWPRNMDKLVTKLVMLLAFLMYFQYCMDSSTVSCVYGVVQLINCSNP